MTGHSRAEFAEWKAQVARERYLARVVKLGPMVRWPAADSSEISRRFEAVLEFLNVKATPRGILRMAAWLLANPGVVTSLQMPKEGRSSPRFEVMEEVDGNRPNLPPPSDANAVQIKLFRHYVGLGLTKADAAKRTAADINADRQIIERDPETRRKDASADSIRKLALRYKGHPLPAWCDAVDRAWESQRWLEKVERAAALNDPFLTRIERLTAAFDEGQIGSVEYREEISKLVEQRLEHAAFAACEDERDKSASLLG